jgi:hypothetical protein
MGVCLTAHRGNGKKWSIFEDLEKFGREHMHYL